MKNKKSRLIGNLEGPDLASKPTVYGSTPNVLQNKKNTNQIWQYKGVPVKWLILATVFSVITGCDAVALALINGYTVQLMLTAANITSTEDESAVIGEATFLSIAHIVAMVLIFGASYCQVFMWRFLSENRIRKASIECFQVLLRQPISWWDQQHSGTINQDINKQIADIRNGLGEKIGMLIQVVVSMVTLSALVAILKWWLLIFITLVAVVAYYGTVLIRKTGATARQTAQKERRLAAHISSEIITHIRTIHAYNAQKFEVNKYEQCQGRLSGALLRAMAVMSSLLSWLEFWNYVAAVPPLILLYGSVTRGELSIGSYLALAMCFGRFTKLIESFIDLYMDVKKAFEALDRLERMKVETNTAQSEKDAGSVDISVSPRWPMFAACKSLEMRNLSFSYPAEQNVTVLDRFNLKVKQNETVAVIGQTGSGKSTVINLLLGFYTNYTGEILINNDYELGGLDPRTWRSRLGVVSQQCVLLDTTIIENIRAGRDHISRDRCIRACQEANAHEFIVTMPAGYDTEIQAGNISGGQQQRLAIARALVGDPDVLILDEPTASLDSQNEALVETAIEKAKVGRATLLISHSLSLVEGADHVIVLSKGVAVEQGSHKALMEMDGLYASMISESERKKEEEMHFNNSQEHNRAGSKRLSKRTNLIGDTGTSLPVAETIMTTKSALASRWKSGEVTLPISHVFACALFSLLAGCSIPIRGLIAFGAIYGLYIGSSSTVLFVCLAASLGGVISAGITFCMTYAFSYLSEQFAGKLKGVTIKQIVRLPIKAFDSPEYSQTALLKLLFEHNDSVKTGLNWHFSRVVSAFFSIVLIVIIISVVDWKLLPVAIFGLPVLVAGHWLRFKQMEGKQGKQDKAGSVRYEALQKIRTIRFLNLAKTFRDRYEALLQEEARQTIKRALVMEGVACSYAKINMLAYSLITLIYGLWAVFDFDVNSLSVILSRLVFAFAGSNLGVTIIYILNFKTAKSSWKLVKEFIEMDTSEHDPRLGGKALNVDGAIGFKNVEFEYESSERRILRGLTFETSPNTLTVIVGRSGSGKSTTLQLIEQFYQTTGGSLTVSGKNIQEHNLHHLRTKIAWLSQNPVLFDATVAENIRYGSTIDDYEQMEKCAQLACAHDFIQELPQGYQTTAGEQGLRFSGGQRQRIALARALYRQPKLLLLDEATSALDVHTEHAILDNLRQWKVSTILVTHRLAAAEMADLVLVMKKGKLVQTGTHEQLYEEPGYYQQLCVGSVMSDAPNTESD